MSVRTRILGVLVVAALGAAGCSSAGDGADAGPAEPTASVEGESALFDSSIVHAIAVTFDDADYDAMIENFTETGDKGWIEATVTIDGVTYERVGLRLKGNSSLGGLGGGLGGGRRPPGADGATGDTTGDTASDTSESTGDTSTTDRAPTRGPAGGIGPVGSATAEEPESLPWLIRLDEFVEGQAHQGYEDLVIRSNGSETSLNEAVALDLLEEAGLASQEAAATSFSVNGSDAVLRLAIEHPDDDAWQEANFQFEGALYKAESSGDWSYRGDDPAAYEEVFDQEGGSDVTDLTPLIEFLQFVSESDDATFAAELSERLDVDSFATYLAMMDLLANFDDIDGPGNNAYLWYDADLNRFTVVPWDMNLAFGGGGFGGAGSGLGDGERGAPGTFEPPEGFEPPDGVELPEGFEPPADGELPEGVDPGALPGGGAGRFGRSNALVERFRANAEFEALYQQKLTELRSSLYESGAADEILASWVETLTVGATDLVQESAVADEADAIAGQFTAE